MINKAVSLNRDSLFIIHEANNFATYSFRGYQGQYQPAVSSSQYYLTNAYITIKTGSDNKEKESEVKFRLIPSGSVNPATSLASFNQNGIGLVIEYKANFALDAWKIEQVQLKKCRIIKGYY